MSTSEVLGDQYPQPNDDWLALGWEDYEPDYLDEVLGDFLDYMDEGGYF